MRLLIGSYADQISLLDDAGKLLAPQVRMPAPSFLATHGPFVYAVSEVDEGAVAAFRVDDTGLTPLGSLPTGGQAPCHVAPSTDGRHVLATNYGSGSVAVFATSPEGALDRRTDLAQHVGGSLDPKRQEGPHAHQVTVLPDGTVHVVDLGMDAIIHSRLAADGQLHHTGTTSVSPLGSGPRHLVRHPSGRFFVANELASTVSTYSAEWKLLDTQPATLVEPAGDNIPSELALSVDARFLYVANRGNDTIATFAVQDAGLLPIDERATGGSWPRHFTLVDGVLYVANQHSNSVTTLAVDADTGAPGAPSVFVELGMPSAVVPC